MANREEQQASGPTFAVYIDESGDEGFRFGAGSSDWFVLSAVITRRAFDLATVKLIDEVRSFLGKPDRKPLHFRDLRHEHRVPFVDRISKANLRTVSVLVHKPSIKEPEKFQERYRLYFLATRYLLERVSWYCRDHRTPRDVGNGSACMIFSNRSSMSYDEMRDYFSHLKANTGFFDVRIDWSVIEVDQIGAATSGKSMGLQIADAVASSLFYAVQPSQYGYTEDRYARILKPVMYHHRGGRCLGYGVKFWPREVEDHVATEKVLGWVYDNG